MSEQKEKSLNEAYEKYRSEGNSKELSQLFHNRAWETANDLNKQLLNLSTASIAGLILLAFNKKEVLLAQNQQLFLLGTIILFGIAILFTILGMQWDANRNYFLGQINDYTQQRERVAHESNKQLYQRKQRKAKMWAKTFFLLGILSAIIFLSIFLFGKS